MLGEDPVRPLRPAEDVGVDLEDHGVAGTHGGILDAVPAAEPARSRRYARRHMGQPERVVVDCYSVFDGSDGRGIGTILSHFPGRAAAPRLGVTVPR